eukprot:scaffold3767_cov114-Isochrysis_galbana.AAC.13
MVPCCLSSVRVCSSEIDRPAPPVSMPMRLSHGTFPVVLRSITAMCGILAFSIRLVASSRHCRVVKADRPHCDGGVQRSPKHRVG